MCVRNANRCAWGNLPSRTAPAAVPDEMCIPTLLPPAQRNVLRQPSDTIRRYGVIEGESNMCRMPNPTWQPFWLKSHWVDRFADASIFIRLAMLDMPGLLLAFWCFCSLRLPILFVVCRLQLRWNLTALSQSTLSQSLAALSNLTV
jgi:hypothetical protein